MQPYLTSSMEGIIGSIDHMQSLCFVYIDALLHKKQKKSVKYYNSGELFTILLYNTSPASTKFVDKKFSKSSAEHNFIS